MLRMSPLLLSILNYNFFVGASFVGPQIRMKRYVTSCTMYDRRDGPRQKSTRKRSTATISQGVNLFLTPTLLYLVHVYDSYLK